MLPILIPENLAKQFKYWQDGIQTGLFYHDELYKQIKKYSLESRLEAYDDGCKLAETGSLVCITVNTHEYILWQSMRVIADKEKTPSSEDDGKVHQASSSSKAVQVASF